MANEKKTVTVKCDVCEKNIVTTIGKNGRPIRKRCKRCSFENLANNRVTKILQTMKLLGNLASGQYEYDNGDITMIIGSIEDALQTYVKSRFLGTTKDNKPVFKL